LDDAPLRVLWGPHLSFFDAAAMELFLGAEYHVSELSDRMGTRLLGMALPRRAKELLSCGVTRGAIQIPPDGQPIVLQAEHQTTGGYPVLATVIRADIPRLAQKRAGEAVRFTVTTLADARAAWQAMLEF
jgi:allophanate hydrolase subunit 2